MDKLEHTHEVQKKTKGEQVFDECASEDESDEDHNHEDDPDNDPHYEVDDEMEGCDDSDDDDYSDQESEYAKYVTVFILSSLVLIIKITMGY